MNYYPGGRLYLSLKTKTKYSHILQALYVTPKVPDITAEMSTTGSLSSSLDTDKNPSPSNNDKDDSNASPIAAESTNETYIKALIAMGIGSMQDMQKINTTKIDKMSTTSEQMTYDNCTQSTQQIEQLQTKKRINHATSTL